MAKKRKLSPIEGVLINRSGVLGHRLRRTERVSQAPKRRPARRGSDDSAS